MSLRSLCGLDKRTGMRNTDVLFCSIVSADCDVSFITHKPTSKRAKGCSWHQWPSETPSPLTVNTNSATFRDHVGAGAISPPASQVHSRVFHVVLETERLVLLAKESRRKVIASHGEGPRWYHRKAAMRVCPFSRVPLFGGVTGEKERQDVFLYSIVVFVFVFLVGGRCHGHFEFILPPARKIK